MMLLIAAAAFSLASPAQTDPDPDARVKARREKLAAPFLKAAPWTLDYEAALKSAAERKVPVFAYFTVSWFG